MYILGIDPGSRKTGWAVVEVSGRKISYINSGVLRFDKIDEFLDRLAIISKEVKELSLEYNPTHIALESLIYVKSIPALAKLAQARGAMIAGVSEKYQGKIFEYSPNLIKSTVTGHGHANKESVEKALQMIFGKIQFKTNDESDALAIAVCHALNLKSPNVSKKPPKKSSGRSLKQALAHKAK